MTKTIEKPTAIATIHCPTCGSRLSDRTKTAEEINRRMSAIGADLARYRIARHPDAKSLEAEWDYLKSIYDKVLTSESKSPQ